MKWHEESPDLPHPNQQVGEMKLFQSRNRLSTS